MKHAIKEAKNFKPNSKLGDRVFLLLDSEGPGIVPGRRRALELPAAEKLAGENGIQIIYSTPAFEYWLLCHFERVSRGQFADCAAVITALNTKWSKISKAAYDKADCDVFDRLSHLLESARAQALINDLHHIKTSRVAYGVNPSTQVYELVATLIGAKSGDRCPLNGTWTLRGDDATEVHLSKGDIMPPHGSKASYWHVRTKHSAP